MTDPFLPYSRQHITDADIEAVVDALRSPIISQGSRLEAFESAFAAATHAAFAVGFSSGTAALHAMCAATGMGPGDEVILPAVTFAATANAVLYTGAKPIFVDIDPSTVCIDPKEAGSAMTEATRAVLAVDFAGHPADYPELRRIAGNHGALVLSDAAHAPGAAIDGRPTSSFADMMAFSFNPVKNVTAAEGGMVALGDADRAEILRQFRTHGMTRAPERLQGPAHGDWYYEQQFLGFNYKLSELHAALGLSQLARLSAHTEARRRLAVVYHDALADLPLSRPEPQANVEPAWHLYVIRVDPSARRPLFDFLRRQNIGVQVHYIPVPMHPYYERLGYGMDQLPRAKAYYESAISLPLHQSMTERDVDRVVAAIRSFYS
ncbi:MAG: aminotransferase class I/II-fold pyridoxal phosphate-dependent enzyme [Rhodothermales bacterium]